MNSTGSTATICAAPPIRAPWMAPVPIPPTPITTTVSPTRIPERFATEPNPVGMAQDSSALGASGSCGSILTREFVDTTVCVANAPTLARWPNGLPSAVWWRYVPSVGIPGVRTPAPMSQMYSMPLAHQRHCPHTATNDITA